MPPRTELGLVDGARPEEGLRAARALPGAQEAGTRTEDRTLLDTFDGRLRAAGAEAVRLPGGEISGDPGPDVRGLRALLPVARVRSTVHAFVVLDERAKTVVRLEVEEPRVGEKDLTPRLRLRGVLGYDKAYRRALRELIVGGVWVPPARTLFDEASLAAGRPPEGVSSKPRVALERGMRADEAAGLLLARLADIAQANVPGTVDDLDTEFLHDLRVAVRRARSVLRELDGVHDPAQRAHVRAELKWVQATTGPLRDLDVQLLDWDGLVAGLDPGRRADLEPLRELLAARRAQALDDLRRDLAGARFAAALQAWRDLAAACPGDAPDRPRAGLPVEAPAAHRIRRVHRAMVRDGRAIGDDAPAEALHDLRKRGKELRYLLELFGGLFDDDVVKPLVRALKRLQDVLGRFQDRAVQADLLEDAGRSLARRATGPQALMALGLVVEALRADQRAARGEFDERFAAFAAKEQRALVKATFPRLEDA